MFSKIENIGRKRVKLSKKERKKKRGEKER